MVDDSLCWLVFYGTRTGIVRAADEHGAWANFLASLAYTGGVHRPPRAGRYVPPVREEVSIRRPRASDRGWIEDSGDPAFIALLPELVDA